MSEWISVKEKLPDGNTYVQVKIRILFNNKKDCLYINDYFVHRGENITKWVTHWKPSAAYHENKQLESESPKEEN